MTEIAIPLPLLSVNWLTMIDKVLYAYLKQHYNNHPPTKKEIKLGGTSFNQVKLYEDVYIQSYHLKDPNELQDPLQTSLLVLNDYGLITLRFKKGEVNRFIVNELPTDLATHTRPPFNLHLSDFRRSISEIRNKAALHFRAGLNIILDNARDVDKALAWYDREFEDTREVTLRDGRAMRVPVTEINDFNFCTTWVVCGGQVLRGPK